MKKGRTAVDDREDNVRIQEFLDMIAPSVIKFETDHFICGNTYRCVWALREYPTATEEQAILSHLGEKDGVTLRIYTRHVTPVEERKIISNAANKNRMDRSNTSDLQQTVLAESNLQDVTTIVAQMHRNREPLLHTAVYLELCAHDLEHLKLLQTEVLTELIRSKLNVDRLILRQQQGFRCVMPSGYNLFKDQFERVLPASSCLLYTSEPGRRHPNRSKQLSIMLYFQPYICSLPCSFLENWERHTLIIGNMGSLNGQHRQFCLPVWYLH